MDWSNQPSSSSSSAVAATYIIISKDKRNCGYGTALMSLLEFAATYGKSLSPTSSLSKTILSSYHYLYLWTRSAVPFYVRKCNYHQCQRVSMIRDCLKIITFQQASSLEESLLKKRLKQMSLLSNSHQEQQHPSKMLSTQSSTETILLPPPTRSGGDNAERGSGVGLQSSDNDSDVWLCKRLVEFVPSFRLPMQVRIKQIQQFIKNTHYGSKVLGYFYIQPSVPWESQIGPSCGLAALRMVHRYYYSLSNVRSIRHHQHSDDVDKKENGPGFGYHSQRTSPTSEWPTHSFTFSLLRHSQRQGYTIDGEMFDAQHMLEISNRLIAASATATSCDKFNEKNSASSCPYQCHLQSLSELSPWNIYQVLSNREKIYSREQHCCGGLYIIPYDSNPRSKLPSSQFKGKYAHYGVIVGIVVVNNGMEGEEKLKEQNGRDAGKSAPRLDTCGSATIVELHPLHNLKAEDRSRLFEMSSIKNSCCNANDDILLLVQHSLSTKLCIATWREFAESNLQLKTCDTLKFKNVSYDSCRSVNANTDGDLQRQQLVLPVPRVSLNLRDKILCLRPAIASHVER